MTDSENGEGTKDSQRSHGSSNDETSVMTTDYGNDDLLADGLGWYVLEEDISLDETRAATIQKVEFVLTKSPSQRRVDSGK
eukprot:CAMPEP_0194064964 /NCGR_PEP_ID=MMETSP0009_2-20130614/84453_1 /TAXON_ID=210454 /ORGANISM="Grammatophora oceanica, Strain CCMP 410" /LENGTH=80 /DNA_ID=CAMNT_0038717647 /DNA_START=17 /DNA_END=256 /DNA_ORIENTATION=+